MGAAAFPRELDIPEEVLAIARALDAAGHEVWCVGGVVRDSLLSARGAAAPPEYAAIDFATSATPEEVQRLFRRTVDIGIAHGTVGVLDRNRVLHEVTTFRRDVATDGRHAVVAYGATLEEDLARRDFTVNAIAYHPLRHEWRDPFRGADDLEAGVIRAVGVPAQRFREDYLRILRAIRFAARFGFRIEAATWAAARESAAGLAVLSAERVRDELFKSLRTARSIPELVSLWSEVGAVTRWIPELASAASGGRRYAAEEANRFPRDPVLLLVLLCDAPAPALRRLRASNAEIARAEALAAGPPAPAGPSPEAVRRWLAALGERARDVATLWQRAEDLASLWRLRHGTSARWADTAAGIRARGDAVLRGQLALDGSDLERLGVPRGPRIGEILGRLLDRVLADPALNTRDHLAALARELA
ncbi:MAG TPA: CCA tRNA nucleotidyltransferase [Gemmatimonadales bacterium]|nr:CCA tRNA nucleotidyltransferase [Gemmatimonadales bacterium]